MISLHPKTNEAFHLLMQGTLALARAERQGIKVDMTYANKKKEELSVKVEALEAAFKSTAFYRHWQHSTGGKALNIYSNAQLATYLYRVKKLEPVGATDSGQGSTDEEALTQLNIPELNDLLQIRKLKKIRDTYLDGFVKEQVNGFIHPSFSLHLVKTYRSSSNNPNFQNIPKRDKEAMNICRGALFPREGHQLLEIDFSGAEVRIAAAYHKDPTMIKYITDPTSDMHADVAKQIFIVDGFNKKIPDHYVLRQAAKNGFVFPQFYGDYYKNCAENMACRWGKLPKGKWKSGMGISMPNGTLSDHLIAQQIKSFDSFTEHVKTIEADFWENRFYAYAKWKKRQWSNYQKTGYIDLLTGFRCSGIMGKNDTSNYPVQGAAFHCLLWTLIKTDAFILKEKLDSKIIGQIHDSLIIDCNPKELQYIIKTVKGFIQNDLPKYWSWINVPMDADAEACPIDASWAELGKFKIN